MVKEEVSGIIIKNGRKIIEDINRQFKYEMKIYNEILRENQNLFLRDTHVKRGKKIYKYWYRYEWDPIKKRTVHKYVGNIKPNEEVSDPPVNLIETLNFKEIKGTNDIILSLKDYEQNRPLFHKCKIQYIIKESKKIKT
ncbi:MAG: hypothetical protein HWN67_17920 [Candidatus Helarchaeota archaeon]|nr:hypothetical protein [Candidatus Helarchaeota archaeon]